ncbi:MAG: SMC-Scp complex subunit ScpB [Desulfosudaceae bacterium]
MSDDLKNIIESLLFVADSPLGLDSLKKIIPDREAGEIRQALEELIAYYEFRQGGFMLYQVAGGYQFRTRPDYKEWVKRMLRPAPVRLSKAALETLAIIAYHQPVIRSDVEHIRGVDSGAIIRTLLERRLIRILGKKEIPGRPLIYATTKRFLEVFNLRSLNDMPSLKEIQEFGRTGVSEEGPAEDEANPGRDAGPDPGETEVASETAEPVAVPDNPEQDVLISADDESEHRGQVASGQEPSGLSGEPEKPPLNNQDDQNKENDA